MKCDVAIIGGGPVGLIEACLLKSLNKELNICVLEGREKATRDFGLTISADSVIKAIQVIDRALTNSHQKIDSNSLSDLKKILRGWSRFPSVRTNQIQTELAAKANAIGVTILSGSAYKITEDNLSQIFDSQASIELLSPELQSLRSSLSQAKIIVGADGSHSVVRKKVMGPDEKNLIDNTTYAYALELKYEISTNSNARPGKLDMKSASSEMGEILSEAIGKPNPETHLLPVTDLLIVNEEIHQCFIEKNNRGEVIKGAPGTAWTFEDLQVKAKTNATVKKYLEKIQRHMARTKRICQANENVTTRPPQITTIPLAIYRSQEIVKLFQNKPVLLIGDASSGLVLKRGFNKGIMEAASSAEAIIKHLNKADQRSENSSEIPKEFALHQEQAQKIFANEKWWIVQKMRLLKIVKFPLSFVIRPLYKFFTFIFKIPTSVIRRIRQSSKSTRTRNLATNN